MTRRFSLIVGLFMFASAVGVARDANLERGGLGFVFPDHNSFANASQFAGSHGIAVEGSFGTDTKVSKPETGDVNAVFGNGRVGLGVDVGRSAPNITKSNNAVDMVTAAGAVALIRERLNVGGSYSRVISALGSGMGLATGTVSLNSPNRHGPSLAFGYQTTVNSAIKQSGITGGVGYSFHSNNNVEANVVFHDTNNFKDYDAGAFFTSAGNMFYAGGGYVFHALASQHEAQGRLGVVLGMRFDVSAKVGYVFASGNPIDYGVTARLSF